MTDETPLSTSPFEAIKMSLVSSFRTDDPLTNMLISSCIVTFVGMLMSLLSSIDFDKMKNIFWKINDYRMAGNTTLVGSKHIDKYMNIRFFYSERLLGLQYYISKLDARTANIRFMKEVHMNERISYNNGNTKRNGENHSMMVDQTNKIILDDDLYCTSSIDKTENRQGQNFYSIETITYRIFSMNHDINYINEKIDKMRDEYLEMMESKCNHLRYHFRYLKNDSDEGMPFYDEAVFETNRAFENVFFEKKDELIGKIDHFINKKEWYDSKGIPWTLGLLFHGTPGCGKTSTIKAIAKQLGRHIIDIPLNRVKTCADLRRIFTTNRINCKEISLKNSIILLEDIDCMSDIVHKRDDKNEKMDVVKIAEEKKEVDSNMILAAAIQGTMNEESSAMNKMIKSMQDDADAITLSYLLNLMDGVLETPGRIIIMTTNHPEVLDPALIRPGRIDMSVEFKKCSSTISKEIVEFFFKDIDYKVKEELPDYEYSPAEVVNFCVFNSDNPDMVVSKLK